MKNRDTWNLKVKWSTNLGLQIENRRDKWQKREKKRELTMESDDNLWLAVEKKGKRKLWYSTHFLCLNSVIYRLNIKLFLYIN